MRKPHGCQRNCPYWVWVGHFLQRPRRRGPRTQRSSLARRRPPGPACPLDEPKKPHVGALWRSDRASRGLGVALKGLGWLSPPNAFRWSDNLRVWTTAPRTLHLEDHLSIADLVDVVGEPAVALRATYLSLGERGHTLVLFLVARRKYLTDFSGACAEYTSRHLACQEEPRKPTPCYLPNPTPILRTHRGPPHDAPPLLHRANALRRRHRGLPRGGRRNPQHARHNLLERGATIDDRFTDALEHEGGALTRDARQPMKLIGTQALSGVAQVPDGRQPTEQRDVTVLEGRPNGHRELPTARPALEDPGANRPLRFRFRPESIRAGRATTRAHGAIRPPDAFDKHACRVFRENLGNRLADCWIIVQVAVLRRAAEPLSTTLA